MKNFKIIILIGLILIIAFASFSPCLRNSFVNWDDNGYVSDNTTLKPFSLSSVKIIFTSFNLGHYHPLTMLSYALEYQFFKLNPFGYHLDNLILHLLNCLLVFWLIFILSENIFISFLTAVLFGIHPLQVESVAWISERKNLLYAFFFLSAMLAYVFYIKSNRELKYYFLGLVLFIFSLLAKSMAVTLPLVLLLVDYFLNRKVGKAMFLDKIPFFILSLVFGIIAIFGVYSSGALRHENSYGLASILIVAAHGVVFYLSKIFLPLKLSCLYPYYGVGDIHFLYSIILALALALMVIISARYTKKIIFGSALFLVVLLPALQFVPNGEMIVSDRYVYIACLGIFYILAAVIFWLFNYKIKYQRFKQVVFLVILILIICVLVAFTRERCRVWKNSLSLWSDVLDKYPNVATAYENRGEYLLSQSKYDQAMDNFKKTIEIDPSYVYPYVNLGNSYKAVGKIEEAISTYKKAIQIDPSFVKAYINLGESYKAVGKIEEAISTYKKAIQIDPSFAKAYFNLGILYNDQNKQDEAVIMYEQALKNNPTSLPVYQNLMKIYGERGKEKEIIQLCQKAIAYNVEFFYAYYHLGNLYNNMNKDAEAVKLYRKASRLNPDNAELYANLGKSYCALGNNRQALVVLKKAVALNPALGLAYNNLAVVYFREGKYDLAVWNCKKAIALGYKVAPKLLEILKPYSK